MAVVAFVVETIGDHKQYIDDFRFLAGNRLYPLRLGTMGER
jgi:hypothetical protein